MKTKQPELGARKKADNLLWGIRELTELIDTAQAEADREFEKLTEKYGAMLEPLRAELKRKEKQIMQLMKTEKVNIFDGKDIVHLTNGTLLHAREDKVTIPRDALEKVEELGFNEAVKIAKSLDRDIVNTWPDEKLVLIGAERKPQDKFSYEIKKQTPEAA